MMPTITVEQAEKAGYPRGVFFPQTILFNKSMSKAKAVDWLKKHGYKHKYYRTVTNFHRFMQHNPVEDARYMTKVLTPEIELVLQSY